ncbi:MAG: hypothetical protein EOO27_21415, partial [Comamonadaceae bacterium]
MNKSFKSIWNEATQSWVAAPEHARARGPSSGRAGALLLLGAGLLAPHSAWAACAATPGSTYASSDGSICTLDPAVTSVTVGAGHVMSASGAGSTWEVDHEVSFTNNFTGNQSQRHGLHADGGGRILLNDGNATYRVTTNGPNTTHPVFASGAASEIRVAGDLVVTGNGGSNPNANTAVRGIIALDTGLVEVLGHTTVNMTNANYPAGANNRAVSAEGGTIRLHTATLSTQGTGGIGILASGGGAGQVLADGLVQITTQGQSAQGISAWNGGQIELAQVDVLTQGAGSAAMSNANGGGSITLAGGALRTEGAGSAGLVQTLGTVKVTGPVTIDTTGANSAGVSLSGTGSLELDQAQIRTASANSVGMLITNSAAQGTELALNGPLLIETQGAGSSGIQSTYNTTNPTTVLAGSSILTKGEAAHGLDLRAPTGDLHGWGVAAGARIEASGENAYPVFLNSPEGKVTFSNAGDLHSTGKSGAGLLVSNALGGTEVTNSGRIEFASDTGAGMAGGGLGGEARFVNAGHIVKVGAGAAAAGIIATHVGGTGTLTLENQGSIRSEAGALTSGLYGRAWGGGHVALYNSGTVGTADKQVEWALSGDVDSATGTVSVSNSGRIDAQTIGISVHSDGGLDITNTGTIAPSVSTAVSMIGNLVLGGTVVNNGEIFASLSAVHSGAAGTVNVRNSGIMRAPFVLSTQPGAGTLSAVNEATGRMEGRAVVGGGQLALDNAGLWTNTGDSTLNQLSNSGTITFSAPVGAFTPRTITVDNYAGSDGFLNLYAQLGDSSSPSDKLVIRDGGAATGHTTLGVTNAGGLGAQTTGNGILVVEAQGKATTQLDAFTQAGAISAGVYDYTLVRNGNESWYLTSDLTTPTPTPTPTPTTGTVAA